MPILLFETLCVVLVVATLAVMARARPARALALEYAALAIAAWLGEATCIAWYGHYDYASVWHGRLAHVPVLVALIWPLVVLSARDVATAVWPRAGAAARIAAVAAIVTIDASLVEVVAVRAGLWRWSEGGHLGVPVIGILGWGCFAASAEACLLAAARWRRDAAPWLGPALVVALAPAATHLLLLALWWGALRHVGRGDLGLASVVGVLVIGGAALVVAVRARRGGGRMPPTTAGPRMLAALLFLALLVTTAPSSVPLWLHVLAVSAPYLTVALARPRPAGADPRRDQGR